MSEGEQSDPEVPVGSEAPGAAAGDEHHAAHGLADADRRASRQGRASALRAGAEIAPYSYPRVEPIATVREAYEHLQTGEETDARHRVAGRIAARRGAGKAAFLDLVDRSGKIQLHARADVLDPAAFKRLLSLDLGDLIGVDGAPLRSRHGELTLRVDAFQILGKALRPPPDKHAGLTDVRDAPAPPRARSDRKRGGAQAVRRSRPDRLGRPRVPGR